MVSLDPALSLLLAHVLYGVPRRSASSAITVALHNGDDFSARDQAPRLDRLRSVRAIGVTGGSPLRAAERGDGTVSVDVSDVPTPAWLVVETEPAFIQLEADAFTRYLRHEGLSHVLHHRSAAGIADTPGREVYSKYAKTALGVATNRLALATTPVGVPVELAPVAGIGVGEDLRVRALVHGQPADGLEIQVHHRADDGARPRLAARVRTDRDGLAVCPIDEPGLWRLHTIAMAPHDDPSQADWRSLWASLTFRL